METTRRDWTRRANWLRVVAFALGVGYAFPPPVDWGGMRAVVVCLAGALWIDWETWRR